MNQYHNASSDRIELTVPAGRSLGQQEVKRMTIGLTSYFSAMCVAILLVVHGGENVQFWIAFNPLIQLPTLFW